MSEGGCLCDNVRIKYTGEVQAQGLCHCLDCRKITGSTYSTNLVIAGEGFSVVKGTPKEYTKKADSNNSISSFFCGDCGSTLWREGASFGTNKIIKVGVLDDPKALEDAKPAFELYVPERVSWVGGVAGAAQKQSMPDSADA